MKSFFITLFTLMNLTALAQLKWSIHAGISHSNGNQKETSFFENDPVFTARNGFVGGVNLQVPLGKKWTYEPGLFYMGKTVRYRTTTMFDFGINGHDQLHYGVLNQNLMLRLWGNRHMRVSMGAGFYGALAMGGSFEKVITVFRGIRKESGSLPIGTKEGDRYRRFDVGGNLLLRAQYRKWQVTTQFSPSITAYDRDGKVRLKSFALMLGYTL